MHPDIAVARDVRERGSEHGVCPRQREERQRRVTVVLRVIRHLPHQEAHRVGEGVVVLAAARVLGEQDEA